MSLIDLLQTNAVAFYGVVAFISVMVGSFLNVVIHRVPLMMERGWRDGVVEYLTDQQSDKDKDKRSPWSFAQSFRPSRSISLYHDHVAHSAETR